VRFAAGRQLRRRVAAARSHALRRARPAAHPQGYGTYITVFYVLCATVLVLVAGTAWLAQLLRKNDQAASTHARWALIGRRGSMTPRRLHGAAALPPPPATCRPQPPAAQSTASSAHLPPSPADDYYAQVCAADPAAG
jgi:hypothetical protein